MLQGQPKGLYVLALANTGERFGYYTTFVIFILFLQAKFGYTVAETSTIFASFSAFVYFMPLIDGTVADKFGYGKVAISGIITMPVDYLLLAIPTDAVSGKIMMFGSLALIACGTRLFKDSLQVMVGNLYDAPEHRSKRGQASSLFYMAINIGAMYVLTAAIKMTDWMLGKYNLFYGSQIPAPAHQFLNGTIPVENKEVLAAPQSAQGFTSNMAALCFTYIEKLSEAYNYGFGVACISSITSMAIYMGFRSIFRHADVNIRQAKASYVPQEELSPVETKQRITVLLLIFVVVLFFWMAFHQNGLIVTFFARDYTANQVTGLDCISFDVINLTLLVIAVYGGFAIAQSTTNKGKTIVGIVTAAALAALGIKYMAIPETITILPQTFQQFNPFFVAVSTPVSLAIFGYPANKKKELSALRKIGLGMIIATCGFLTLAIDSMGLPTLDALAADSKLQIPVSPNWLISTYPVLTFTRLLFSPTGISLVSKVAPPKCKGMIMGGWFVAAAIGNYLVTIIGYLWGGVQLWMVWSVLIVLCLLPALFMFPIMKRLDKVVQQLETRG